MYSESPIEPLAKAYYSAIFNDLGNPNPRYLKVYHFEQQWGSTALGFGGMGGASMTNAYTTIVCTRNQAAVYFDGKLAYIVPFSRKLLNDIQNHRLPSVVDQTYDESE